MHLRKLNRYVRVESGEFDAGWDGVCTGCVTLRADWEGRAHRFLRLIALNCGYLRLFQIFIFLAESRIRISEATQRTKGTKKPRIVASVACCRLLSDIRGGGRGRKLQEPTSKLPPSRGTLWRTSKLGGKGFSILLGNLQGVGKGRNNSRQIPTQSGNGKCNFIGEMEGGWEFPAFSRYRPLRVRNLECGVRNWGRIQRRGAKGKEETVKRRVRENVERGRRDCGRQMRKTLSLATRGLFSNCA
jgi:hypothetical protein